MNFTVALSFFLEKTHICKNLFILFIEPGERKRWQILNMSHAKHQTVNLVYL